MEVTSAAASGELDFMECEGPEFDPAWAAFKRQFSARLSRGQRPSEELASRAADLLDAVESEEDIAVPIAAFAELLRGEAPPGDYVLGGFCVYGAVAAYTCVAMYLDSPGAGEVGMPPTAKRSVALALLLLAKKLSNDFLESSGWPIRSMDLVAMIETEDAAAVRRLPQSFQLPCRYRLGCMATREAAEKMAWRPPLPPLSATWPERVAAIGMHITSTLEVVTALTAAMAESWGRGGAAGAGPEVTYAGHPCPTHQGSEHQCAMKCELLGQCGAEATDPVAEFIAGAVDVEKFEEREAYTLDEARHALRWAAGRLATLRRAELLVCTFPTVLCTLLHEIWPDKPLLFVAIANPLFAAPGCSWREESTVRDCQTEEAQGFLVALRAMLQPSETPSPVRGVAAYSVTAALVDFQAGVSLPLAGKAARYLPPGAHWRPASATAPEAEVLVARSRLLETMVGRSLRFLLASFQRSLKPASHLLLQQEMGSYLSYEELSRFRAVVILQQDLGLHKFTEHYAMAMPIWMPSREWAYRLQMTVPWGMVSYSGSWRGGNDSHRLEAGPPGDPRRLRAPGDGEMRGVSEDHDLVHEPWFNAESVPYQLVKVAYWYEFSEFVAYPAVQAFDSVPELLATLDSAGLAVISARMRQFRAELWQTTRAVYAAAAAELAAFASAGSTPTEVPS